MAGRTEAIEVAGQGGVRLAGWQCGAPAAGAAPDRPAVLLLHGLMGHARHWADTARWLAERYRVVALDQRGHGASERPADAYGPGVFAADAEAAVEQLGLAPVALVGHAMGALTAWQLAARRPELVRALVICDMRASALGAKSQREWQEWFASWPLPFATRAEAAHWFGEADPRLPEPRPARGEYFAEVMVEREDGWWPAFSRRQLLAARAAWALDAHWEELAQVACPTLVVRGPDGELGRAEAQEMVRVLPRGRYAELPDAGHLPHRERPAEWRAALAPFLAETAAADPASWVGPAGTRP